MVKKLKDVLDNFNLVHNNRYDYSKVDYKNSKTKIEVICPEHGSFFPTPIRHNKGSGCRKCKDIERGKKLRLSYESFINKVNLKHNYKYDYTNTNFKTTRDIVLIVCPEHGQFKINANNHLKGQGCQKCSIIKVSDDLKFTKNQYVEKAINVHGNHYDYSKTKYNGYKNSIIVKCRKHDNEFTILPGNHMKGDGGCRKCLSINISNRTRISLQDFINKSNLKHNNKYDYSKVKYGKSGKDKVIIICPNHGEFHQKPCIHIQGSGCQKCTHRISKGEQKWLEKFKNPDILKQQLIKTKYNKTLIVDGYDPHTNTVYQYHGCFWHGCPKCFDPKGINVISKIKNKTLYEKTLQNNKTIVDSGYKLVFIWEHEFTTKK